MKNIHKLADEIFKAPSKDELLKRALEQFIKNPDGTYNSDKSVYLKSPLVQNGRLAISFKYVDGGFHCGSEHLYSLEGCPETVSGYFDCSGNWLTSLKGAPKSVGEDFDCSFNRLTSLESGPEIVGGSFVCAYNLLTSLEGAPKIVKGNFVCNNNKREFSYKDITYYTNLSGKVLTLIGGKGVPMKNIMFYSFYQDM